ncbi:hypothetical protein [Priestia aryabhattai]|uniref:hypothetical protein n=1 Tax=Priestia aryabhattai TaxID=412384 RepID=UPI001593BAD0
MIFTVISPLKDPKVLGIIIGGSITLLTFIATQLINHLKDLKKNRRDLITLVTQTHSKLFSLIYQGSCNKEKINYIGIRQELERINLIYVLPKKLKEPFKNLYNVYNGNEDFYKDNKHKIHGFLVKIVQELDRIK